MNRTSRFCSLDLKREYSPSETARFLTDNFDHKVTPAVIRKWDNLILSEAIKKNRQKGMVRKYNVDDLKVFNIIAVLRNFDYSIQDVKETLKIIFSYKDLGDKDSVGRSRYLEIFKRYNEHFAKQEQAFLEANMFLQNMLKVK